ncbi:MAG: hypothetical protein HY785_14810 [Oscillatoriophycideae cyanobacterium NC_groundwater_1537_Pr4_S-0.65um_50_18]|nr:hypothetical protein [Oscillatoriophycideae cyanobacterium NC_groundwater_1537_Pr4_S-0.65um_50_18]
MTIFRNSNPQALRLGVLFMGWRDRPAFSNHDRPEGIDRATCLVVWMLLKPLHEQGLNLDRLFT